MFLRYFRLFSVVIFARFGMEVLPPPASSSGGGGHQLHHSQQQQQQHLQQQQQQQHHVDQVMAMQQVRKEYVL